MKRREIFDGASSTYSHMCFILFILNRVENGGLKN